MVWGLKFGIHMAKIAKGFGMSILGYSRSYDPIFKTLGIEFLKLNDVLKNADVLMLAVPLTPNTHNLINHKNAKLLKKECIIINVARNEIMECSLYHTLPNTIACDIDQKDALLNKKNILHTPHMAYYTQEALKRILDISLENMQQFIKGEVPQHCLKIQCKKEYT
jgi:D-lactate dehydrogenase